MDESIRRNLDTQHRRLAEIEAETERLLAGDDGTGLEPAPAEPMRYDALTVANDALRIDRGWTEIDLDAALSPELRAEFATWQARQRLRWGVDDVAAVALAGFVGMGATWFDSTIDRAVRLKLKKLEESEPFATWEKESKRLAIDHFAPGATAQTHRLSSGHDLLRFWAGLQQVRSGEFAGLSWMEGKRIAVRADRYNPLTAPYRQVENIGEALTLLAKHLATDVITPMSLPLPGWSFLALPSEQLATFAEDTFRYGMNLRSGLLSTLPGLSTELIVRTHIHGRAMLGRGSAKLQRREEALRSELLLAAHSIVGAASLGKALTRALLLPPSVATPVATAMAFRHVNWPVLMRAAMLSIEVTQDSRARRTAAAPGWDELLLDLAGPWQLDIAREVDAEVAASF